MSRKKFTRVKLFSILTVIAAITLLLCSCMAENSDGDLIAQDIGVKKQSIKYSTSPSYGDYDEMIRTEITVFEDGSVLKEEYYVFDDDLISSEELNVSKEDFLFIQKSLADNDFSSLPEEIDTDTLDGSYYYIEANTDTVIHKSGGLNVITEDERFAVIAKILLDVISRAKP